MAIGRFRDEVSRLWHHALALASNDFEPAVSPRSLLAGLHVTAIQADRQRQIRPRQLVPVELAAIGEHRLLGTELALQPFASCLSVQAYS